LFGRENLSKGRERTQSGLWMGTALWVVKPPLLVCDWGGLLTCYLPVWKTLYLSPVPLVSSPGNGDQLVGIAYLPALRGGRKRVHICLPWLLLGTLPTLCTPTEPVGSKINQ
jgi:hypothetical protein